MVASWPVTAFYDPHLTYEDNYARGPFGAFREAPVERPMLAGESFLGHHVRVPFGIPAGPLVNAAFCAAAFAQGFDVNVYKTVRTRAFPVHEFPNTLAVRVGNHLSLDDAARGVIAGGDFSDSPSITNSFGVPSRDPGEWQPDMAAAVSSADEGQLLVGSFQGTRAGATSSVADRFAAYVADHVAAARLVAETGVPVLEMNTSCPNEGSANLLCFDVDSVRRIVDAVKAEVPDTPLLLKIAYFPDDALLRELVEATAGIVQGYSAINTIPARLVTDDGRQALPGEGREFGGVCGAAIHWAGLEMVGRLARIRAEKAMDFAIVGVGGVMGPEHYRSMRHAGADAVMSATGAMFVPRLAVRIAEQECL